MLTNPCAQAATVRAAGSDASGAHERRHGLDEWPADVRDRLRIGLHLGSDVREEEPVAVRVRVDEGPIGERRAAQVGPRVVGRDGLAQGATEVVGHRVGDGPDERRPVRERACRATGHGRRPGRRRGHRDGVEPAFLEDANGPRRGSRRVTFGLGLDSCVR